MKMKWIILLCCVVLVGCATRQAKTIPLVVNWQGVIHCLGRPLSGNQLRQILTSRLEEEKPLHVVIAVAKDAPQKDVDALASICRSAGVKDYTITRSKTLTGIELTQEHRKQYESTISNK